MTFLVSSRDSDANVELPAIDMTTNPFTVDTDNNVHSPTDTDRGEQDPTEHDESVPAEEHESVPPVESDFIRDSNVPIVETVTDDYKDYSPMDDPPLQDEPVVEMFRDPDEDVAPQIRDKKDKEDPEEARTFEFENLRTENPTAQGLSPDDLIGRTFLMPPDNDGSRVRARIIQKIQDHKQDLQEHPELAKFKCTINGDDDWQDVVAYNDIVDFIEQDQTWDGVWKFREILNHHGPISTPKDKNWRTKKINPKDPKQYRGSSYNVLVEWETGERTWEPLHTKEDTGVRDTDPVTAAIYARKHDLLDTPGWKSPTLRRLAKTQQRIIRRANQAKLHSFRMKPVYMYGFLVPRNHDQAMELDRQNGNTRWKDAETVELKQIDDYKSFLDKGKGYNPGPDYKKIRVHMVYAVKHDGRHKARLVAGGHLTETPIDSVYSSVVSLRGIRILTFIAELNDLEVWCTDVGNAYLESYTKEKVYIVAGPEFGELEGHVLIIQKALYGLKSSGLHWHEQFADVLRDAGFIPSKAESDIWMRDKGDHWEYIAVYVDDLLIASKDPQAIIDMLEKDYNFKLKGTGPISFHLGCDFFRDDDGNLCYAPKKYIEKILDNYKRIFGANPRTTLSPLAKGDHPELDTSPLLDDEKTRTHQSLIGALQWVIQIGRFDITTAVMTMSRFRAAPREGHMERVKRIHGYLSKMRHGVIRIRADEPDYSVLPVKVYDWANTCYTGAREEIPSNMPRPLGKPVRTTSYFDANLYHDLISGRSVTGILHLFNKTPIDWFSKLQSTVETATFGSEYVSARTCTEQIIDLRTTLRYLGVPIQGSSIIFGDNETCINTASVPHGKLHKRHNALSYHRTREAVAAGITRLYHIRGENNPADILSKHWDYPSIWGTLRPLLFWRFVPPESVSQDKPDSDQPQAHRGE